MNTFIKLTSYMQNSILLSKFLNCKENCKYIYVLCQSLLHYNADNQYVVTEALLLDQSLCKY